MRGHRLCIAALALAVLVVWAGPAAAQPAHARPASALFFPVYDSSPNAGTVISVTNTNSSRLSCGNGFRTGDVCVHYTYYDSEVCLEVDKTECLTPGDTLTLLADRHNPEGTRGWLWVEARDPETQEAIDFDYLVGSAIVVLAGGGAEEEDTDFMWSYTPYAFRALVVDCPPEGESNCGFCFTDFVNPGFADFGVEYESFPGTLYLDNFFAEDGTPNIENTLYLMIPDGIGGFNFRLNVIGFNNNEVLFSRILTIPCWFANSLGSITSQVKEPNLKIGAADELPNPKSGGFLYTGWMRFRVTASGEQDTRGVLGVFVNEIGGANPFAAGRELQYEGSADVPVSIRRFF